MKTVEVTVGAVFQNGEGLRGFAEIQLNQSSVVVDRDIVVAIEPQRVRIRDKDDVIRLVPNGLIGEDSNYTITLYREDPDRFYGVKKLLTVTAIVPEYDCRLADLITGRLYPPDTPVDPDTPGTASKLDYANLDYLILQ